MPRIAYGDDQIGYDSDSDAENVGNSIYDDPAAMFRAMNLPVPDIKSANEVRHDADKLRKSVITNFHMLQAIIERHEETIQRRWLKKTRNQRVAVLLKAWPTMPAMHRPDFEAWRQDAPGYYGKRLDNPRDAYLMPYMNQEDLSKPRSFLLMLNARSRYHPCLFAAADFEQMRMGVVTHKLNRAYLNEWTMILNGDPASPTIDKDYGTLVSWDDNPDASDWTFTRAQFIPGDGLVILEAQERVLSFLLYCCKELLHELDPKTILDAPVLPEPVLKQEAEAVGFESLAVMASESPYRVPAKIDFNRIISLLAARTSAAEDHLWSLREDPTYFVNTLLEFKEHRTELIPDMNGEEHPTLERFRLPIFWSRVIGSMLVSAYLMHESFAQLLAQARHIQELQEKYSAQIKPGDPLPEEYLKAILKFQFHLGRVAKGPLAQFKTAVPGSPPMRHLFVREPPVDKITSKIGVQSRPQAIRSDVVAQLVHLLSTLWNDDEQLFLMRMTTAVDELERLINTEPEAKNLISAHVASLIGDLSIVCQCLAQIDSYQPWSNSFENNFTKYKTEIETQVGIEHLPLGRILEAVKDFNLVEATKLGTPTGSRFAYPFEKRRTKETTLALRQAEHNLDAFWANIDRIMYVKAGNLEGTATHRLLTQPRMLQRTPEWVEKVIEPKAGGKTKAASAGAAANATNAAAALHNPLSAFYFGLTEKPQQGRQTISVKGKTKTKTKGTAAAPTADLTALTIEEPVVEDAQPTMPVDARALKVFRTIFFNADANSTPGEVPWKDFLHAMTSTGFQAEKLYGSVWQFQPTNLDVERSIQFHEPHPRGKMTYEVARRIGRRLNRAYGWVGEMFQLKK